MLDDVEDQIDWEVQGGEGYEAFGLHYHGRSVLLGS